MMYTTEVEESSRSFQSLPATRLFSTRWKYEDTHRQRNRIQE